MSRNVHSKARQTPRRRAFGCANPPDATIAFGMAKFKPAKGKSKTRAVPQGGLPCVILVIGGFILVLLFVYFVMKNAI